MAQIMEMKKELEQLKKENEELKKETKKKEILANLTGYCCAFVDYGHPESPNDEKRVAKEYLHEICDCPDLLKEIEEQAVGEEEESDEEEDE